MSHTKHFSFSGPKVWLLSATVGLLLGAGLSFLAPPAAHAGHGALPIPLWLLAPFALMLGCIALMPFVNKRFWETYYPDIAFVLGGTVAGYFLMAFGPSGQHALSHAGLEYVQFIALIGSLYVVSGGVLIQISGRGRPTVNTALLAAGAVLANVVGTTGASMLLIRPFLRINKDRLKPFHIALFIMIVSNCGGCLTPVGDPPLFLGYLKGVPFLWMLENLWPAWLFVNGALLTIFCVMDSKVATSEGATHPSKLRRATHEDDAQTKTTLKISGVSSLLILPLLMASVIFDSHIKEVTKLPEVPCGAILQIILAVIAYRLADRRILAQNSFNWHPVQEVACLFVGIFATMVPALAFLEGNARGLFLNTPTHYYFAAGSLSAVLDNAPTYLSFLQAAFAACGLELASEQMPEFLTGRFTIGGVERVAGAALLRAISMGSVFFGALTYIGNGPNFMVKAIAEAEGAPAPSFFGYLKYALVVLLPVLIAAWALFVRVH